MTRHVFLPIRVGESCANRAARLLGTVRACPEGAQLRNDLRRMALVMAIAGLDAYLHARVLRESSRWNRSMQFPGAWRKLEVSIQDLAQLARDTVLSRKRNKDSRPWTRVRKALQSRILKMPFQSSEDVQFALSLCGIKQPWVKIGEQLGADPKAARQRLDGIVHRRNRIVHEGDLERLIRPRSLAFNRVKASSVKNDLAWVAQLVKAIDRVVE